jgi:hypothetical protein
MPSIESLLPVVRSNQSQRRSLLYQYSRLRQ